MDTTSDVVQSSDNASTDTVLASVSASDVAFAADGLPMDCNDEGDSDSEGTA